MSKLFLIRHAQASFLSKDYDNLSEHGHCQSTQLGEYYANKNVLFDKAYIGPLKRHHQTYQRVKEAYQVAGLPFPEAIEIEELKEYEGMDVMGTVRKELEMHQPQFKSWFAEMETNPTHKTKMKMVVTYLNLWATNQLGFDLPKDAQTFADFRQIAEAGLAKVMQGNEKGKTVAVFSSGGCIAAMLGKVLDLSNPEKVMGFNLVMRNTAISEVLFSGNRLSLMTFNDLQHLTGEMVTTM
ncbi:MAG: histidine phosphatase family protein [Bacteroidota bacterium]